MAEHSNCFLRLILFLRLPCWNAIILFSLCTYFHFYNCFGMILDYICENVRKQYLWINAQWYTEFFWFIFRSLASDWLCKFLWVCNGITFLLTDSLIFCFCSDSAPIMVRPGVRRPLSPGIYQVLTSEVWKNVWKIGQVPFRINSLIQFSHC